MIFFYSDRYGWSLPADWHSPAKIEEFRKEAARYFVIYDGRLLSEHPELVAYLTAEAEQIGPGIENGCAIYRFSD